MTGHRVNFVKRVDSPFTWSSAWTRAQHQVVQVPGTGPIWAVFHRPGTHPYVVHIYDGKTTTTLHGVVEVVEDPISAHGRSGTCGRS